MRIALCAPNFPPEFLGGTERVVLAIARALRASGDEILLVAGSDRPWQGLDLVEEEFAGFPVHRLPRQPDEGYGLDVRRPRLRARFAQLLAEAEVDLVHVHHWATLSTGLLRAAAEIGVPGIASLHDMWTNCPRFFRRPPAGVACPLGAGREPCVGCVRQALPQLGEAATRDGLSRRDLDLRDELRSARRITAPSAAGRDRVREHLPWDGPIEVVPHGLLEPVPPGECASRGPGPKLRIGTFGNLVEEKGVMLLVYACRGIPNLELHLHGPFLEPAFAELVRAKAAEFRVELHEHGAYGAADPHPALGLDLAVFPSLCEETYGLVVEEALARGVPVVVSDRGALAERIGAGGIAVAVDELGPLAATLAALCAAPQRIDALRAGIPGRFATIRDAAARYRQLYAAVRTEVSA
jgi:glycosyltransferase involved in cell wall biosynthesis